MTANKSKVDVELTLEMIQKICKGQEDIFQEDSRYILETQSRKEEFEKLYKKMKDMIINEKKHYELIRSIFNSEVPKPNEAPKFIFEKDRNLKIPGLKDLTVTVLKTNDTKIIDYFTFSILPSYFNFFLTNDSIEKLIEYLLLMRLIGQDVYNLLSRVIFLTPNFLHFSKLAFQPIFSMFLKEPNKTIDVNSEEEMNFLLGSLSRFKYLIPREVLVCLSCSENFKITLRDSFINYSLSSKNASFIYGIFHHSHFQLRDDFFPKMKKVFIAMIDQIGTRLFSNDNCEKIMKKVAKITKKYPALDISKITEFGMDNFENPELTKFVSLVNKTKSSSARFSNFEESYYPDFDKNFDVGNNGYDDGVVENSFEFPTIKSSALFSKRNSSKLPEIFQPIFGTNNDVNFFLLKERENLSDFQICDVDSTLYRIYDEEDEIQETDLNDECQTYDKRDLISYLRHLLQITDKLPEFSSIPPNAKTLQEFFEVYLVKRGDIVTYKKRKFYSDSFFNFFHLELPKDFNYAIQRIGFERENNIRALSAFNSINSRMKNVCSILESSNDILQCIYYFPLYEKKGIFKKYDEYFKKKNFEDDCDKYQRQISPPTFLSKSVSDFLSIKFILSEIEIDFDSILKSIYSDKFNTDFSRDLSLFLSDENEFNKLMVDTIQIKEINDEWDRLIKLIELFKFNYYNESYLLKSKDANGFNNDEIFIGQINKNNKLMKHTSIPKEVLERYYKTVNLISDLIVESFNENCILRKLDIFQLVYEIIYDLIQSFLGCLLGKDQCTPAFIFIIMRINPPKFLQNFVLFNSFIQFIPKDDYTYAFFRSIFDAINYSIIEFLKSQNGKKYKEEKKFQIFLMKYRISLQ